MMGKALAYLLAFGVNMAVPVFALPILTRWLSPADYGVLAIGQVVALLFAAVVNLGIGTGFERNFFTHERHPGQLDSLLYTTSAFLIGGLIAWGALLYAARAWLSLVLTGSRSFGLVMWIQCLTVGVGLLGLLQLTGFRNGGRTRAYVAYSVGGVVLEHALAIGLVVAGHMGVLGVVVGQLGGKLIVLGLMWRQAFCGRRARLDPSLVRPLLAIGWPVLPKACVGVAEMLLDRVLVRWLGSLSQVGVFGLAHAAGYAVFSFLTSLEQAYIPQVYRSMFQADHDGGRRIGTYLTPYLYGSLAVPVLLVLFAEEALRILVPPAYYAIKDPLALLAVYYGQMVFGKIVGAQLLYRKKVWYTIPFGVARVLVHLGLALLWIPRHGAFGAAASLWVSGVLMEWLAVVVAQREYPIHYERRVVLPLVALLYASMGWVLLPRVAPLSYDALLCGKIVLLGAVGLIGMRWIPQLRESLGRFHRQRHGLAASLPLADAVETRA
ncbi:MAG: lipopolysaccharide biosynthesis protein [Candidatus Omnitrophica bacterium]|nr:lipopolysaccharide biosynthesis protein [Candidatus Omnitrophota bacterium]